MKTQSNSTGVGFRQTEGEIKKVTKEHSPKDLGKIFIDDFGRAYVYTKQGLIY
jgi:hypothetical protein